MDRLGWISMYLYALAGSGRTSLVDRLGWISMYLYALAGSGRTSPISMDRLGWISMHLHASGQDAPGTSQYMTHNAWGRSAKWTESR